MGLQKILVLVCLLGLLNSCSNNRSSTGITNYDNSKLKSGTLIYQAPQEWTKTAPRIPMRIDEYIIDESSDTRLAIYYFPNMIDAVEENLSRWKSQFKEDEYRKLIDKKQFNRSDLSFTLYHMTGTYLEKLEPMNPESKVQEKPDFATWGAIIETKEGTWFLKTVGPISVIESNKKTLDNLLDSCKLGGQGH